MTHNCFYFIIYQKMSETRAGVCIWKIIQSRSLFVYYTRKCESWAISKVCAYFRRIKNIRILKTGVSFEKIDLHPGK